MVNTTYSVANWYRPSFFIMSSYLLRADGVTLVKTIVWGCLFVSGLGGCAVSMEPEREGRPSEPANRRFLLMGVELTCAGEDIDNLDGSICRRVSSNLLSVVLLPLLVLLLLCVLPGFVTGLLAGACPIENLALICSFISTLGAWTGIVAGVFCFLAICRLAMDSTEMGSESLGGKISCSASSSYASASCICRFLVKLSPTVGFLKSRATQLLVAIVCRLVSTFESSCVDPSLDDDTSLCISQLQTNPRPFTTLTRCLQIAWCERFHLAWFHWLSSLLACNDKPLRSFDYKVFFWQSFAFTFASRNPQ